MIGKKVTFKNKGEKIQQIWFITQECWLVLALVFKN